MTSRKQLILALGGGVLLAAGAIVTWLTLPPTTVDLDGRYGSQGQVRLGSGEVLDASYSILFTEGRYYAMSRQGDVIVETSGKVETDWRGSYRLLVEKGDVTELNAQLDNSLLFNLLYSRHPGAVIHLKPLYAACLYAQETQQVYCANNP